MTMLLLTTRLILGVICERERMRERERDRMKTLGRRDLARKKERHNDTTTTRPARKEHTLGDG